MRNSIDVAAVAQLGRGSEGQDLLEYGLLMSLIATFVIGALTLVGQQLNDVWVVIASTRF